MPIATTTLSTKYRSVQTDTSVSCKEGGGGKNVFCSKKINFDFTVFLYANLPFFKKTNGGKWREHFPAETSHLFYPNRKHYNQKPSKNLNLSKCLHAMSA
jgi:hypothetical protein